jgi:RimJ/RimL family protein N-acetyltransferase
MATSDVMELSKYGVTLKRLTFDKIELVRNWRNDPKISQYMEFRGYITSEMQQRWFENIDNCFNYYFIINYNGEEVGLVNIKNIDITYKCAEPGIFIYEDKYLNTDVGFRTALCNMDFAFEGLDLNYLYGYVMQFNKRTIRYSKALGFVLDEGQDSSEKQRYVLTKGRYFEHREWMVKLFQTVGKSNG